jgi:branched-chain amino acid transport system permease protein
MIAINWTSFTGGAEGLFIRSLPRILGFDFFNRTVEFYMALGWLSLALLVAWWLSWSKFGYYLQAIREDQDSAMAMGINPTRYKILAFMLSAALTAAGGALYAVYMSFFEPHIVFDIGVSIELALGVLIIVIVRFAPEGIVGGWQFLARRWPRDRRIAAQPAD